jgi:hypothetical protein
MCGRNCRIVPELIKEFLAEFEEGVNSDIKKLLCIDEKDNAYLCLGFY